MDPLFGLKELLGRAFERKWVIVCLILLVLCSTMCGIVFIKTPVFFDYHLKICDRFLDDICYSDRSVFTIFLERFFSHVLVLAVVTLGGVHPISLVLTSSALVFRGYVFGGSVAIFFSVYKFSGALVCITLYIPIHLLADFVLFVAGFLSFSRSFRFSFCASDFKELFFDFLKLSALLLLVFLLEMLLLGVFFHLSV